MEIRNANIKDLVTPTKFAAQRGINRTFVYKLIDKQEVDYTVIDGVTFIVMNDKAKSYVKSR